MKKLSYPGALIFKVLRSPTDVRFEIVHSRVGIELQCAPKNKNKL